MIRIEHISMDYPIGDSVCHALQDVSRLLGVEEAHGQPQQLHEEVGHKRYVDLCSDVQQQPPPDEVDDRPSQGDGQLSCQHEADESHVLSGDASVHDRLREEGQRQLQQAGHEQSEHHLQQL